jgi:hypothetical protein
MNGAFVHLTWTKAPFIVGVAGMRAATWSFVHVCS